MFWKEQCISSLVLYTTAFLSVSQSFVIHRILLMLSVLNVFLAAVSTDNGEHCEGGEPT